MSERGANSSDQEPADRSQNVIRKQKSSWLSRCVRIVIAKHSPLAILECGLPMWAVEKIGELGATCSRAHFSLIRFV
jgi:hypothetical protein